MRYFEFFQLVCCFLAGQCVTCAFTMALCSYSTEQRLCPTDSGTMNVFDRKINFDALFKFSHM